MMENLKLAFVCMVLLGLAIGLLGVLNMGPEFTRSSVSLLTGKVENGNARAVVVVVGFVLILIGAMGYQLADGVVREEKEPDLEQKESPTQVS